MSLRYAPSPTGILHVGNLRTAWISHQLAVLWGLEWQLRFEDIDRPRVVVGAMEQQLADLALLGLIPQKVTIQSARRARHFALFERARASGALYACTCSRSEVRGDLERVASAPHASEALYSGRCRHNAPVLSESVVESVAWRFKDPSDLSGVRDFIVARSDVQLNEASFLPAYHWACAIDDFDEGHKALVRAVDLAGALPSQRKIMELIGSFEGARPWPAAFHCSLVTHDDGHRLEKRSRGVTLSELATRGLGAAELIDIFKRSFRAPEAPFCLGSIEGESRTQLSLRDLGIAV